MLVDGFSCGKAGRCSRSQVFQDGQLMAQPRPIEAFALCSHPTAPAAHVV
jgi:hypothetical protein